MVDMDTLNRFKKEKLKFVGKRKLISEDPEQDKDEEVDEQDEDLDDDPMGKKAFKISRLSDDNYEYQGETEDLGLDVDVDEDAAAAIGQLPKGDGASRSSDDRADGAKRADDRFSPAPMRSAR